MIFTPAADVNPERAAARASYQAAAVFRRCPGRAAMASSPAAAVAADSVLADGAAAAAGPPAVSAVSAAGAAAAADASSNCAARTRVDLHSIDPSNRRD